MPQTNADNRLLADGAPNADVSRTMNSTAAVPPPGGTTPPSGGPEYDLWLTNRVLADLAPCHDPDDLLQRLRPLMQELFPHDAGLVATVERDPDGGLALRLTAAHGLNGQAAHLPDPLTPATTVMRPAGMRSVALFKLFAVAPESSVQRSATGRFGR